MQIVDIPIKQVIPYEDNPRINKDAVEVVKRSLSEYGFQQPLVVDNNNVLVVGHTRLLAAKLLGHETVPCFIAGDLSEEQVKAYRIMDNRSAEFADWNTSLLLKEVGELLDVDFDVDLTGFSEFDLKELGLDFDLGYVDEPKSEEDDVPDVEEDPVSKSGDVFILGNHRLICGDSTNVEHMERLLGDDLADLWITDPPYNVGYVGKTADSLTIKNDEMDDQSFRSFLFEAYSAANSFMNSGASFYIWHADSEGYNFRGAAKDVGWQVRQCLIWVKNAMVMGRQDYHWQHEPCLYGWKDGAAHCWESDRSQTTTMNFNKPSRNKEHPTMKPVELFKYQIQNSSKQGSVVLDSFGGSGTTIIACESAERQARLLELDPKYCDVIIKRWQNFTEKDAVLEGDNIKFNDLQKITENDQ